MKSKKPHLFSVCGLAVWLTACGGGDVPPDPVPPQPDPIEEPDFVFHKEGEPFDTYRGLVMAGYQGWFGCPGDGSRHAAKWNTAWYHYRENDRFEPGVLQNSIDFWPDMREYEKQYTPGVDGEARSSKPFFYPDGRKAAVYSAYDRSSVMLHFKWMQEYGIDGVFMQRFVGEVINNPDGKEHFDKVLESAMEASNTCQRAICVMYDLGGFRSDASRGVPQVLADAQAIYDKYRIGDRTVQKFYLHHNGKPLIVLWGVGFSDNRPYSLTDIEQLMKGLREKGFSIMLGVPTYWRERRNDAVADPKLHELIRAADIIMPWFVGRYGDHNYESGGFKRLIEDDIDWCKRNKVDYAPLCFPGISDRNMHPGNAVNPRLGGRFLWNQIHHCIASGAQMLYIAMFDEIDEGTAIYKCLNQKDVPGNHPAEDYYVAYQNGRYRLSPTPVEVASAKDWCRKASEMDITFIGIEDNLPTDHYLWLTGQGRRMLRGEIPLQSTLPVR